ncbi:GntR family transcriptional regulator [Planomonospora sp. ID91781]|uniref:HTH gntR-type domain-containing protein n=1 Tax=Planomonospora alba TaxID=161354 RepID=A0ABP6MVU0_9ACTN|nr:GntR family transcriptional regulator [Planomonospora sp. ID91781]MBG0820354.1 GntR family transcriptional regulator [Planomonospora sp. ID91781]
MIDYDPTRPKWVQIYEVVRARIESGEYPPQSLISEVKLEAEFSVARVTIRKVTAKLREDRLIVTTPGMGSFVAPKTNETPEQP